MAQQLHGEASSEASEQYDVFLSYSRSDEDFARKLRARLEQAGLTVWMDRDQIRAGLPYVTQIAEGIHSSKSLVVVISTNSVGSTWVEKEASLAEHRRIPVIPAIREQRERLPAFLPIYQHVDFSRDDRFEQGLDELIQSIRESSGAISAGDDLDSTGRRPKSRSVLNTPKRRIVAAVGAIVCLGALSFWPNIRDLDPAVAPRNNPAEEGKEEVIEYTEKLEPNPSDYFDDDQLDTKPVVAAEDVRFVIRNLTRHEIELLMVNCAIYRATREPDYDPFEQPRNGAFSRIRLRPNEAIPRPFVSNLGWYVFFVRRIDGDWHPYRQFGRDVGVKNICQKRNVLLTISEGVEKGGPYVWTFEESDEPIPEFNRPEGDAA